MKDSNCWVSNLKWRTQHFPWQPPPFLWYFFTSACTSDIVTTTIRSEWRDSSHEMLLEVDDVKKNQIIVIQLRGRMYLIVIY